MEIHEWLELFKQAWTAHDTDRVLSLFEPDVEYWETPYARLGSFEELAREWRGIQRQEDIELELQVFQSYNSSHSVIWKLAYADVAGDKKVWAGTYLIRLSNAGKCTYFHQTGEPK